MFNLKDIASQIQKQNEESRKGGFDYITYHIKSVTLLGESYPLVGDDGEEREYVNTRYQVTDNKVTADLDLSTNVDKLPEDLSSVTSITIGRYYRVVKGEKVYNSAPINNPEAEDKDYLPTKWKITALAVKQAASVVVGE